jgi:uncharacterized membrane protein YfcA
MQTKKNIMETQTIIILVLIGMVAGTLSGMVGIGGGIVIVPALVYFLGFSQMNAQGSSLALIMLPVGFWGVIQYYKMGYVNYNVVLVLAVGFVLGSFFGSRISLSLPQDTVKKMFAILMIVIACKMLFFDKKKAATGEKAGKVAAQ